MHIEFLVEEPSAEAALMNLLPKILGAEVTYTIHPFQGKHDLLKQLPDRLRGYKKYLSGDSRIVVLHDEDGEDCKKQKERLECTAWEAGFFTKTSGSKKPIRVLNRLAVEELEAWFFGDMEAIITAYPKVSRHLERKAKFRNPDAIPGGTWEALERVLKQTGYYSCGMPKIEVARTISKYMDPSRNQSNSFCVFREGLLDLIQ
ncbi:MAG: DUF4276 family protein [Candidatus Omnitrophota bacterium]|nr:MAG: DUF4276 family protein [Candidatus Omnitrophota bacterium]